MNTPAPSPQINSHPRLRRGITASACVAALIFTHSIVPALAQTADGTVTGTVVDASTGKFLEGADVSVEGSTLHVATEREGRFILRAVPVGPRKLVVSYPGLDAATAAITVSASQATSSQIRLGSGNIVQLSEFRVAGTKEGMAQAIALQKSSDNLKLVAAGDQYGDVAEGNAAEYIKFLPGVGIDYNANDARAATLRGMSTAFTSVTLNGNPMASATSGSTGRRFEFEQVSINNIETVEVFKTLTPEMPATSTGGSINMVTKSAFDRQGSLLSYRTYLQATSSDLYLKATEGWGQQKTQKIMPGFDLNYATRLREDLGFNVSYKNSQLFNNYPRSTYSWEYNPANGASPLTPALSSWTLQNEQKNTRRQALSGQVDYKLAPHTKLSVSGQWNFYDLLFTDRAVSIATGGLPLQPGSTSPALSTSATPAYNYGTVVGRAGLGSISVQSINRWKSGVTWNGTANLTHHFANAAKLEASSYWSQAYSKYRDTTGSWFSDATMARTGLTVTFSNIGEVVPSYLLTDANGGIDPRDMSKYSLNQVRSRPQTAVDTRNGGSLDYKLPLKTTIPMIIKVGTRVDSTTRNIDNRVFNRTGALATTGFGGTSAVTGAPLAALVDDNFSQHGIGYGLPAFNFISVYKAYTQLGGNPYLPYTPASDTIARFDDSTKAGYARFDVRPFSEFLVVAGVRYEDRLTDSANRLSTLPKIATAKFKYQGSYPSLNLKYTPTQNLVLRFGAATSIGLPDYNDLLPGLPAINDPDPANPNSRGSISIYNPNLAPYQVVNYDAGIEYYFNRSGYASASVFRKSLRNFIFNSRQTLTAASAAELEITQGALGSPFEQYDVTYNYNVPESGHYNGIELGYAQNFSFLPKPFNTIGLQANATLLQVDPIKTKAVFNNSPTDPNLNAAILDQVNNTLEVAAVKRAFNVTLNYTLGKFGFTVTSNYTGKVLKGISRKTIRYSNAAPAVNSYFNELSYQAPRELVDIRMDYKWNRRFTPYFQARNILGRPIVTSSPSVPLNHAEYGDPIFELGVRGVW